MDDMRSEIRAACEKGQAAHAMPGGLRNNLTGAVATQTRPARNLQWIAFAVGAVLSLLIVAGLMSKRLGPRAGVPGRSGMKCARRASRTSSADCGPPPGRSFSIAPA